MARRCLSRTSGRRIAAIVALETFSRQLGSLAIRRIVCWAFALASGRRPLARFAFAAANWFGVRGYIPLGIENPHCFKLRVQSFTTRPPRRVFCLGAFRPPLAGDPLPRDSGSNFFPVRLLTPLAAGRSPFASLIRPPPNGQRGGERDWLGLGASPELGGTALTCSLRSQFFFTWPPAGASRACGSTRCTTARLFCAERPPARNIESSGGFRTEDVVVFSVPWNLSVW